MWLEYTSTGDFTGSLWTSDYTVAQVIYNYSIVNLIKSYPHDTLKCIPFDWNLMKETKWIKIHKINKWFIKKISINNLNLIYMV